MPHFKGKLAKPIAGSSGGTGRGGEMIPVLIKGLLISEDGDSFYNHMRSIYNSFIKHFEKKILTSGKTPDALSHFIVRQELDGDFELIVDDIQIQDEVLTKTKVNKYDPVFVSQIADLRRIVLPNLNLSSRVTILFFFTSNWRHGLYFDFGCVHNDNYTLDLEEIGANLAQCFLALWYPTFYRIDAVTTRLKESGWFSFLALAGELYENLYSVYENDAKPGNKEWIVT